MNGKNQIIFNGLKIHLKNILLLKKWPIHQLTAIHIWSHIITKSMHGLKI